MASDIPEPLTVGSLVAFSAAPGHSQPDFYEGAPITLVPGVGEPLIGRVLAHTSEEVAVAIADTRLTLTPVAATLDENGSLDYKGAWTVRSVTPLA
ncbi:hypothetical protein FZC33_05785 [Labrys sp. KNU-23]|uniref:hypothetical protein n=1 Tax=Labrys sp. KNU-23 TaxID=2789216 RepID=UPI0011ED50F8|nr:hypothetical protein [Labrys sp. KNU-23]QEN85743.1 hypothetical protein FZC33_05785 [Labrys sp. KNU-23]